MKIFSQAVLFIFLLLLLANPAYAYLDPGTGSMLLQGLLAGIMAMGVTIGIYWRRLKAFFSGADKQEKNDEDVRKP